MEHDFFGLPIHHGGGLRGTKATTSGLLAQEPVIYVDGEVNHPGRILGRTE